VKLGAYLAQPEPFVVQSRWSVDELTLSVADEGQWLRENELWLGTPRRSVVDQRLSLVEPLLLLVGRGLVRGEGPPWLADQGLSVGGHRVWLDDEWFFG
jgi:hypothetical protein